MADYKGHETFFIIAPVTYSTIPSRELAAHAFPGVTIRGEFAGDAGFFDCSKAERLIGWVHDMSNWQTDPPTSKA
jgi:UDP-glucose 4-epimerase